MSSTRGAGERATAEVLPGGRPSPGPRLGAFRSTVIGEEVQGRPLASS